MLASTAFRKPRFVAANIARRTIWSQSVGARARDSVTAVDGRLLPAGDVGAARVYIIERTRKTFEERCFCALRLTQV